MRSFAKFTEQNVRSKMNGLIKGDPQKAQLAARGQLLLASLDKGKTFDQLIGPEQVSKADPLEYTLLSPTLRSETTNLQEVLDEQTLLHVQSNLVENGFVVNAGQISRGLIRLEVESRTKNVRYLVEADARAPITKPMDYQFTNVDNQERVIAETVLPEVIDELQLGVGFDTPSIGIRNAVERKGDQAHRVSELGAVTIEALGEAPQQGVVLPPPPAYSLATLPVGMATLGQAGTLSDLGNVMAAKARVSRQRVQIEAGKEREAKRYEQAQVEEARLKREQLEAKAQPAAPKKRGLLGKGLAAAGGGILMGAGGAAIGWPVFINTIMQSIS